MSLATLCILFCTILFWWSVSGNPSLNYTSAIYVAGGDGDTGCGPVSNQVNIFDINQKRWCKAINLPQTLALYGATYFQNLVYIVGGTTGWCDQLGYSNVSYMFHPFNNTFTTTVPLSDEYYDVHADVVENAVAITATVAFSGDVAKASLLQAGRWHHGPALQYHGQQYAQVNWKNSLWVIGGITPPAQGSVVTASVEVWDVTKTQTFVNGPSLLNPRANNAAAVIGNSIYTCGGVDVGGSTPIISCERLTMNDDGTIKENWTEVSPMINPRSEFSLVAFNNTLFAVGSTDDVDAPVEQYDPTTNEWTVYSNSSNPASIQDTRAIVLPVFPYAYMDCSVTIGQKPRTEIRKKFRTPKFSPIRRRM